MNQCLSERGEESIIIKIYLLSIYDKISCFVQNDGYLELLANKFGNHPDAVWLPGVPGLPPCDTT